MKLIGAVAAPAGESSDLALLRRAHGEITSRVRPVYSVTDDRPVSRTLTMGRGSCSQRLALLEAVARGSGIATRVRGLLVDGRFWYPRFRRIRFLVPDDVLLAWPEFLADSGWIEASELFGEIDELRALRSSGFTNSDGETLFEAIACTSRLGRSDQGLGGYRGVQSLGERHRRPRSVRLARRPLPHARPNLDVARPDGSRADPRTLVGMNWR